MRSPQARYPTNLGGMIATTGYLLSALVWLVMIAVLGALLFVIVRAAVLSALRRHAAETATTSHTSD